MKKLIHSIRFQFMLLVLLLIVSMMGATVYSIVQHETTLLRKERKLRGFSVLRTWASIAKERLLGDNLDIELSMYDLIDDISHSEGNIESMMILDANGRIVIHQDLKRNNTIDSSHVAQAILKERKIGVYQSEKQDKTTYHLFAPITHKNKFYGTARIDINDSGIQEAIQDGIISILIIAGILLGLGMFITVMLVYKVLEPIGLLVHGAKIIGRGDLQHKINYTARNELGRLAEEFNHMTTNLKQAQEDIVRKTLIEQNLKKKASVLQKMATTDELTGLFNKRQFSEDIENYLTQSKENGVNLTIMMLDMDKFKVLNDTVGHDAGDVALQDLSRSILDNIRHENDNAYRIGGDEFIILTLGPTLEAATLMSQRIAHTYDDIKHKDNLTGISFGIIAYNGTDSSKEFFKKADTEMFRVKNEKGAAR